MSEIVKFVKNSIKHWYLLLIIGILFVGLAFLSFSRPLDTYLTLAVLFGAVFLVSGFLEVIFSIANSKEIDNWGWSLISGLLTLIVGLILVAHPGITMVTLPFIVGFAMLFKSIGAIGHAIDLKKYKVADWGYLLTMGILGTLFSIFIIWHPLAGGLAVSVWIGLTFLIIGLYSIYFSLKMRNLKKLPGKLSKELKDKYEAIQKEIAEASA